MPRTRFVETRAKLTAAAILIGIPFVVPLVAEDAAPRTTKDGVYTTEQAEQGRETYTRKCAECHPLDWYKGETMKSWDGAALSGLYDAISTKMPQNNPGSLKRREYVALLAYILSLNDLPAGKDEIPEDAESLSKITIKWRNNP